MGSVYVLYPDQKFAQAVPPTGGGNRGSLPQAPSVKEAPNSAELIQWFIILIPV